MMIKRIEKAYNDSLAKGYDEKGAVILCICAILGIIVGYFGSIALVGAIIMWLWNLFAPMFGCAFVFTYWHGIGVMVAWKILRAIVLGLFKK